MLNLRISAGRLVVLAATCGFFAALVTSGMSQSGGVTPQHPWMDRNLAPDRRADLVIAQMTLDEKIGLVHGAGLVGFDHTAKEAAAGVLARSNGGAGFVPGIPRLGIPDLNMAD